MVGGDVLFPHWGLDLGAGVAMVVLGLRFGGGMGVGGGWAAGFGGGRPGWWLAVRPPALAGRFRTPRKAQELDIDRFRHDCEKST